MNPFSRFLSNRMRNRSLQQFVSQWDHLEALVIRVYKGKQVTASDEQEYQAVRSWLDEHYREWEEGLTRYWKHTTINHKPTPADPFRHLFRSTSAMQFLDNWAAMQNLAPAREALNQLIKEKSQSH